MGKKKMDYGLSFISSQNLYHHVFETVKRYSFRLNLKDFNRNLIDPIKLTFDSIVYSQGVEKTIENEVLRQLDKSNSNLIGYFHQNIFKYFGDEWSLPEGGYDIQSLKQNIFVEMKNKHNTMNSSSSAKTYMRMLNTLIENDKSVCMLVEVIAKQSQNIPWVVTLDGHKQNTNKRIRRVSIDKFYEFVTGEKDAFMNLCKVMPLVISDVVSDMKQKKRGNSVFSELTAYSDDLLSTIYLLSFNHYEGFDDFKIG